MPVVAYLGPATAITVTGSIIVEQIFGIPGIGRYFVDGAISRDYPLVMGVTVLYGAVIILANLLTNALQYTQDNGAVRVQLRQENETLIVSVRDNGLGFSPVELDKAGEPFQRFDRSGATTGNGLGLAICSALAQRMHGTVFIRSRQNEGTIAELRLPRG